MNNTEKEKVTYFTPTDVILLSKRYPAKSLVTSSRPPGFPFMVYDPAKHGKGYMADDLDERRESLSSWR